MSREKNHDAALLSGQLVTEQLVTENSTIHQGAAEEKLIGACHSCIANLECLCSLVVLTASKALTE